MSLMSMMGNMFNGGLGFVGGTGTAGKSILRGSDAFQSKNANEQVNGYEDIAKKFNKGMMNLAQTEANNILLDETVKTANKASQRSMATAKESTGNIRNM